MYFCCLKFENIILLKYLVYRVSLFRYFGLRIVVIFIKFKYFIKYNNFFNIFYINIFIMNVIFKLRSWIWNIVKLMDFVIVLKVGSI